MKLYKLLFILLIFLSTIIFTSGVYTITHTGIEHDLNSTALQAHLNNDSVTNYDTKNLSLEEKDYKNFQHFNPSEFYAKELLLIYQNDTACDLIKTTFFDDKNHADMLNTYLDDSRMALGYLQDYLSFLLRCRNIQSEAPYAIDKKLKELTKDFSKGMITFGYYYKCSGIGMDGFCLLSNNFLTDSNVFIPKIIDSYSNSNIDCRQGVPIHFIGAIVNLNKDLYDPFFECNNFTSQVEISNHGIVTVNFHDEGKSVKKDLSAGESQTVNANVTTEGDRIASEGFPEIINDNF